MTDAQWAVIEPLLPPRPAACLGGRPRVHARRLLIDTIMYVLVSGCAWRLVPHDLAPWNTAYKLFRAWTADGTWERVHDTLRDQVRLADGRDPQPSAAVLDSQSARSHQGGEQIGYDAGKRVRGRKRHLLADTNGLVLRAVVHSASVQDRPGARLVLTGITAVFPLLGLVWVDGGYVNTVDTSLVRWAADTEGIEIVPVPRNTDVKGFQVLPRRWVVERTFSWLTRCRRLRTGQLYYRIRDRKRAVEFWAFVKSLRARWPGERLYLILDNYSVHKRREVREWCARNEIELVFVPTYSSWLNRIECEFAALRYFALNGTDHRTHAVQDAAIGDYVRWRNQHALPIRDFAVGSRIRRPDYLLNIA